MNIEFEIRNNKLDQLQGMSAKIDAEQFDSQPFLLTYPEAGLAYYL